MDAYLGEIRVFAGNFAPNGWALCDGSLLPISRYTALFSILGVQYGGDGRVTFALPDLRGSAPIHQGQGPGLTARYVGEKFGESTVELQIAQIPPHTHIPMAINQPGGQSDPTNNFWSESKTVGRPPVQTPLYTSGVNVNMPQTALSVTGEGQPHNNMQPYLAMNFIICMDGIFPPRE